MLILVREFLTTIAVVDILIVYAILIGFIYLSSTSIQ